MANKEINDLANKATPVSTDEVEIQETGGGTSYKATAGNLAKGMSHGDIGGLGDDDHTQYILADGTRAFSGDVDFGDNELSQIDRLEIRDDNVVNRISYPLTGLSAFQQTLKIVIDGAKVYMETDAVTTGSDQAYVFDEEKHVLDCTTGAGTGGDAQVELTVGTATAPQINYVYVEPDGVGVAKLSASTTLPSGTFAWHSIVTLQDVVTLAADGPLNLQRTTEALKHNGRGQLSYMREKLRWLGAKYISGCALTLDDGAALNLTVASGSVFQLHRQTFPGLNVVADGASVANADGGGVLDEFEVVNDLDDIAELADGTVIGNNKYFSFTVWATMASSDQDGNQSKLFVNLPSDYYLSSSAAIADSSNFDVRTAPSEFNNTAFLVGRITCKRSGGANVPIGEGVYSLLGSPMGTIGGGAGSVALTEFDDTIFHIYDNTDPTKIIDFEADQITTGNTRTVTMADADIDLANTPTSGEKTVLGNTSGSNSGDQAAGDFNHDDLANIPANDHIDWTADQGATNIHSGNYTDTNTQLSDAQVKTAYENNADTNEFSDAEKTLLGNQSGSNTGDDPGLENVSEDASPTLGGTLDVGGETIEATSGDITLKLNSSGNFIINDEADAEQFKINSNGLTTMGGTLAMGGFAITTSSTVDGIDVATDVGANTSHRGLTNNPHSVDASDVSLGNVDNTSNATERAASATLTNKSIDGDDNTLTDIGTSSIKDDAITDAKRTRMKACQIYRSTTTTGVTNSYALVTLGDARYDPEGWHYDVATSGVGDQDGIKVGEAGLYQIVQKATDQSSGDTEMTYMKIMKNQTTAIGYEYVWGGASSEIDSGTNVQITVLAADDEISFYAKNDDNASQLDDCELMVIKLSD